MSSSIHTALHHRLTLPSWVVAALVAAVVAIAALAIAAGSGDSTSLSTAKAAPAPYQQLPTSCIDNTVVGHC
jgi:hypothetical protein